MTADRYSRPGETNGRAKLDDLTVIDIAVGYYARGLRPAAMARTYGVHRATIWWALKRRWPKLLPPQERARLVMASRPVTPSRPVSQRSAGRRVRAGRAGS